jgi:two-component system capsular synthesis sensor histidine kinase RcsC
MKRIKQVLFNLIGNAVKFTFSGSVAVTFDFEQSTQTLKGAVQDTGVGIKPEDI